MNDNPLMRAATATLVPEEVEKAKKYKWHTSYGFDVDVMTILKVILAYNKSHEHVLYALATCMINNLCNVLEGINTEDTFEDSHAKMEGVHSYTEEQLLAAYNGLEDWSDNYIISAIEQDRFSFCYTDYRGALVDYKELGRAIYACGQDLRECIDWVRNVFYGIIDSAGKVKYTTEYEG